MPRTRTTKKLAQRIDLNYFQRPAPLRRWKFWLSVALPALALAALGWHALRGDARDFSAGALAPSHALLTSRCEACHTRAAGGGFAGPFSARAGDAACLACHDGPPHHASAAFTPSCGACHVEHRGAVRLAATADAACVQCHGDLRTRAGTSTTFARACESFTSQHPEFAVLREGGGDPTSIKLNHFRHMQPNLKGPKGPVQLACQDCHRAPADTRAWPYSASGAASAAAANAATARAPGNPLSSPPSRAYLAAPTYAAACSGCHTLEFDKRFSEGVPHDKPEIVHAFLVRKFQSYIAAHPAELREPRQPGRNLPEQPVLSSPGSAYRNVTPAEWVAESTAEAEELLWRKTCVQCHALNFPPASRATLWPAATGTAQGGELPSIAPSNITVRFMPHARFDHSAHEFLKCESCHARALSSQESSDLLLPGIATCRACHRSDAQSGAGAQAAESRCFECHSYHDQSQWRPAPGRFTLPELRPASFFWR